MDSGLTMVHMNLIKSEIEQDKIATNAQILNWNRFASNQSLINVHLRNKYLLIQEGVPGTAAGA